MHTTNRQTATCAHAYQGKFSAQRAAPGKPTGGTAVFTFTCSCCTSADKAALDALAVLFFVFSSFFLFFFSIFLDAAFFLFFFLPPLFPEDVELVGAVNDAPSPAPAPSVSAPAASPELPSTEGSLLVFVSDVSGVWACFPLSSFDAFASTSATWASAAVLPVPSISAAAAAAAAFAAAAFSFFLLFLLLPTMALPPTPVTSRAFGVHMTSY